MKLLFIITGLSTGGAEIMLYNLLSRINREKFEPVVISLMKRGTLNACIEALGISVYTLGMQRIPTLVSLWHLVYTVRQLKPDLIQGWMYHGNLAAQLANILCFPNLPVLWSIHYSIDLVAAEKPITALVIVICKYISKLSHKIIFVSKTSQLIHAKFGYFKENNCIIPNGFDSSLFRPSERAKVRVRSELGLPEKSLIIGLVARYHPMKDHANFIQAASLLARNYPDLYFLLVGQGIERGNKILNQLIQDFGLVRQIHLLGERHDIPKLTAALDIASSSSSYGEAFPLAIGEAMCCGVPSVVTDVGDSAWIVGDTGRVVPPRNPQALANAWKELIDLGSDGRQALGKGARERIIEYFSLDSVVEQYEALYENMLKKK
ncbi:MULTISPECIES: glycosyltransferase [unclassified Coleofasciculus]|uniref:glycosyltransferase family 4 protein n=1 Tax=Cyanophyceae TaxID=3028117 RepID=UPI001685F976|nr:MULTISPECIES: glycosyltransferase [unclassified Coleofasciculus]MBD1896897.1 glycosyltransferase [Coleofasciculus sp. FACHB-129]MBD2087552.1 glycosyltransferase [Coleofasciculus sp. FACHB-542]